MKRIVYTAADGSSLCITTPVEGGRLARSVRLADGREVVFQVLKSPEICEVIAPAVYGDDGELQAPETVAFTPAVYESAVVPVWRIIRPWPLDGAVAEWAETEEEFIARITERDVPANAIDVHVVDEDDVPTDRTFRNAWSHDGKVFGVDMGKAREITKMRLRFERAGSLAALDIAYLRADEAGDTRLKADIAAEKQRLRDITELVEHIVDLDGLKAISALMATGLTQQQAEILAA